MFLLMLIKRQAKTTAQRENVEARLNRDIALFLKRGGKIQKLPSVQEPRKPMLDIRYGFN
jgi:hypothetical protein